MTIERWAPILFGLLGLIIWQASVVALHTPPYVLPGPMAIIAAFTADWQSLLISLAQPSASPPPPCSPPPCLA